VSYSRGYKAGGFNLDRFTQAGDSAVDFADILAGNSQYPAQFEPEIVDAFEWGFKTEWLQNQLLANLILFYSDFETYQLNTFNGIAFFVTSIDGATSQGAELELLYLPEQIEGLTLNGGLTYAQTEYDEFAPTGTGDVDYLSGHTFSLSPKFYLTGSASYRAPLNNGLEWLAHLDGRWVSKQNTGSDLDYVKMQDAYTLLNARIGIGAQSEEWAVELFARNLLDEEYMQVAFDGPFQPGAGGSRANNIATGSFNAFLGQPRTWGVTLRSRF
jgi:iron complex outermembrane receptor protein